MSTTGKTEIFHGKCACGAVKYEAVLPTENGIPAQALCHCIFCKRMTGSCFTRSTVVAEPDFRILPADDQEQHLKSWRPETTVFAATMFFCSKCGSQIYSKNTSVSDSVYIRVGTLDRQAEFVDVVMQVNCENESKWLRDCLKDEKEGRFETFPPEVSQRSQAAKKE